MFKKQHFASVLDVPDFVQLLTHALYDQAQCERVHPPWDRVEEFLSSAGSEIRDMLALEMFERFQNAGYPSGGDSFARFLGPEMQRLWAGLQAIWKTSIMLDLQDRTVLEGEVLISRIVNHRAIQL